jgi:hypothetical protein
MRAMFSSKTTGTTSIRRLAAAVAIVPALTLVVAPVDGAPTASAAPTITTLSTSASRYQTTFSPDLQYIAYRDGTDVKSYLLPTGATTTLGSSLSPGSGVVVSPDSQRAIFQTAGTPIQRVSVPIGGGTAANLDADGLMEYYDETTNRLVYQVPGTASMTLDVFSVPVDGGTPTFITNYDSNTQRVIPPAVNVGNVPDYRLPGYVMVGGAFGANAPIAAYPVAGGPAISFGVAGEAVAAIGDRAIYADAALDQFARQVPGGTPVPLSVEWSLDPGTFSTGSAASNRIAWYTGSEIQVQSLDGGPLWTLDVTGKNIYGVSFTPTGNELIYFDCTGCTTGGPSVHYVEITGSGGPLTSTPVPGATDIANFYGSQFGDTVSNPTVYPDGRILVLQTPTAAPTATFVMWTPGQPTSDTITVSWKQSTDFNGLAVTPGATDLLVTGDDDVIRRVRLGSDGFGVPEVIETTPDSVVAAQRVGNEIVYLTVPDPSACPFGNTAYCDGTLKLIDDPTSAVTMLAAPERVMDSRPIGLTVDGIAAKEGPLGSAANDPFGNGVYRLSIAGRAGIPQDAAAAVLNVTAVQPSANGFLTVFPCNGAVPQPPLSASLNYTSTTTAVSNNVNVGLDTAGDVCIYSSATANIIVDVAGSYPSGSAFVTITPERFVDTRVAAKAADVVPGGVVGGGPGVAATTLMFDVAGLGSVPVDATAVSMNIAAVKPTSGGFATAYPCDATPPTTAVLNFQQATNLSNGVLIGVAQTSTPSTDGKVCVVTSTPTDIVVDVTGYYGPGQGFVPAAPARFLETRKGPSFTTIDGLAEGGGEIVGGTSITVQVTGRPGVPADASAVALNLAAIRPDAEALTGFTTPGYVSASPGPCSTVAPTTANLVVQTNDAARANGAIVALGSSGEICLFASRDLHLVADVSGYYPA